MATALREEIVAASQHLDKSLFMELPAQKMFAETPIWDIELDLGNGIALRLTAGFTEPQTDPDHICTLQQIEGHTYRAPDNGRPEVSPAECQRSGSDDNTFWNLHLLQPAIHHLAKLQLLKSGDCRNTRYCCHKIQRGKNIWKRNLEDGQYPSRARSAREK